jgi:hypothetical protein
LEAAVRGFHQSRSKHCIRFTAYSPFNGVHIEVFFPPQVRFACYCRQPPAQIVDEIVKRRVSLGKRGGGECAPKNVTHPRSLAALLDGSTRVEA